MVARAVKQVRAELIVERNFAVLVTSDDSTAPADWTTGSPQEDAVGRESVARSLKSTSFSYLKI